MPCAEFQAAQGIFASDCRSAVAAGIRRNRQGSDDAARRAALKTYGKFSPGLHLAALNMVPRWVTVNRPHNASSEAGQRSPEQTHASRIAVALGKVVYVVYDVEQASHVGISVRVVPLRNQVIELPQKIET